MPPQTNTLEPTAVYAENCRAANPGGGAAVTTHFGVQAESVHVRPAPQALPQLPQFAASFVGFTHFVLQRICGDAQAGATH
jgi:hypothetical protein